MNYYQVEFKDPDDFLKTQTEDFIKTIWLTLHNSTWVFTHNYWQYQKIKYIVFIII